MPYLGHRVFEGKRGLSLIPLKLHSTMLSAWWMFDKYMTSLGCGPEWEMCVRAHTHTQLRRVGRLSLSPDTLSGESCVLAEVESCLRPRKFARFANSGTPSSYKQAT